MTHGKVRVCCELPVRRIAIRRLDYCEHSLEMDQGEVRLALKQQMRMIVGFEFNPMSVLCATTCW